MDWDNEQYKGPLAHYISTALLGTLQALNLFWLFLIFRVAYRAVTSSGLEDERSDNDDDELAEEQRLDALAQENVEKSNTLQAVKEEGGVSSARLDNKGKGRNRKAA